MARFAFRGDFDRCDYRNNGNGQFREGETSRKGYHFLPAVQMGRFERGKVERVTVGNRGTNRGKKLIVLCRLRVTGNADGVGCHNVADRRPPAGGNSGGRGCDARARQRGFVEIFGTTDDEGLNDSLNRRTRLRERSVDLGRPDLSVRSFLNRLSAHSGSSNSRRRAPSEEQWGDGALMRQSLSVLPGAFRLPANPLRFAVAGRDLRC